MLIFQLNKKRKKKDACPYFLTNTYLFTSIINYCARVRQRTSTRRDSFMSCVNSFIITSDTNNHPLSIDSSLNSALRHGTSHQRIIVPRDNHHLTSYTDFKVLVYTCFFKLFLEKYIALYTVNALWFSCSC